MREGVREGEEGKGDRGKDPLRIIVRLFFGSIVKSNGRINCGKRASA